MASSKASPGGKPTGPPPAQSTKTNTPIVGAAPGAPGAPPSNEQPQEVPVEVVKPNVKTMAVVEYLGMVDKLLQQGLEILVVDRPENPVEFLSIFLKEKDPNKRPPQFYKTGPPPPKSACGCRVGPPLPPTSCGCFHEPGWEPNPEFPPVGWPDSTSIGFVKAIDTIALP